MKVVRLNQRQLRRLIESELKEAGAGVAGANNVSIKRLEDALATAKAELSNIYQATSNPEASEHAEQLLRNLLSMMKAVPQLASVAANDPQARSRR